MTEIFDEDDEEGLSPHILEQVRRLQARIDRRESLRREHVARSRGLRRRLEDWEEQRALRSSVDYLEMEFAERDGDRRTGRAALPR
ncbi:MAG TPA: hypothetical protein VIS55_03200 [Pseudomonadales bacterium]|jgi:hypothetical protein